MRISDWSSDVCSSDLVEDHLGVGGRLEDGAVVHQAAPQVARIGEVAVVRQREAAAGEIREQRLDVAQRRLAGGRIAVVTDGGVAGEARHDAFGGEDIADQAKVAVSVEVLRSEEHTSELQSLMRISYAGFCLKKKNSENIPIHEIRQ